VIGVMPKGGHSIACGLDRRARWTADGRSNPNVRGGGSLEPGTPEPLFPTGIGGALQTNSWAQYIPSPDGRRFLMNTLVEEAASPITVILNWHPKS
jgi:hypothetical protein